MESQSLSRAEASLVEKPGDLCFCVMIQQAVDFGHHLGRSLSCFPGVERSRHGQRFRNPTLETNVRRDLMVSDQGYVVQQKPYQSLSFAVRRSEEHTSELQS